MRRCLIFLCVLVLLLTACGGSPEEQMYGAVFDSYFAQRNHLENLKHNVVYIQPAFMNSPQQLVPPAIVAAVVAQARRLGLTQVLAPDYDGLIIRMYPIDRSRQNPIISLDTHFSAGHAIDSYELVHDALGWHAVWIGGIGE